jgi:xanthine/uracil/vitamin C permease (AzgA family)
MLAFNAMIVVVRNRLAVVNIVRVISEHTKPVLNKVFFIALLAIRNLHGAVILDAMVNTFHGDAGVRAYEVVPLHARHARLFVRVNLAERDLSVRVLLAVTVVEEVVVLARLALIRSLGVLVAMRNNRVRKA